jgi:hypothetical protein
MIKYPMQVRCELCGKTAGNHNATDQACPLGRTSAFQQYYRTQRFVPKMPRVTKRIQRILENYSNALVAVTNAGTDVTPSQTDELNYAKYQLSIILGDVK